MIRLSFIHPSHINYPKRSGWLIKKKKKGKYRPKTHTPIAKSADINNQIQHKTRTFFTCRSLLYISIGYPKSVVSRHPREIRNELKILCPMSYLYLRSYAVLPLAECVVGRLIILHRIAALLLSLNLIRNQAELLNLYDTISLFLIWMAHKHTHKQKCACSPAKRHTTPNKTEKVIVRIP